MVADHVILNEHELLSRHKDNSALVVMDRHTKYIGSYPMAHHTTDNTNIALEHFAGAGFKVKRIYTDGSGELKGAAGRLNWLRDVSTPHRPQTNGVAERAVRKILEGSRSLLLESGLSYGWWAEATKCFAVLHNVSVPAIDGLTPYQLRNGADFKGKLVPFGAEIQHKPAAAREIELLKKFGSRMLQGVFVGYHFHSGGQWSGDYLVVDADAYRKSYERNSTYVHRVK